MDIGVSPIISARDLRVRFPVPPGQPPVTALNGVSFDVAPGEFVAVIGQSGAGKTALLRCLTGFVRPNWGGLIVAGVDVSQASASELKRLRRETATVSQHFGLVERASALDNVLVGRLGYVGTLRSLAGWFPKSDRDLAYDTLCEFGLGERALRRVDQLSGGERQRVAIARALVQRPQLVLADEPAASLDISLTLFVLDTLRRLNREHNLTVVTNLHNLHLARTYASRIIALRHGVPVFDGPPAQLNDIIQREVYHGGTSGSGAATGTDRPPRIAASAG
jgi:phosphonate transport system ATP-binding protein